MLPVAKGPCKAGFKRYYYNSTLKQCQKFAYGGCLGNANNFLDLPSCLRHCAGGRATATSECVQRRDPFYYRSHSLLPTSGGGLAQLQRRELLRDAMHGNGRLRTETVQLAGILLVSRNRRPRGAQQSNAAASSRTPTLRSRRDE